MSELDDADADDLDDPSADDAFDPQQNRLTTAMAAVLHHADLFGLLRLDPLRRRRVVLGKRYFHSWRVLRRRRIDDPALRAVLVQAIERGLAESDGGVTMCFDPTLGLHAGQDTVDLICCFDCNWIRVRGHIDGQPVGCTLRTSGSPFGVLSRLVADQQLREPGHRPFPPEE